MALRRRIMAICYIHNGLGMEFVSQRLFTRLSFDLQMLQAAWGCEFDFYDFQFVDWVEGREDHLFTNNGCDDGVVKHALAMVQARRESDIAIQRAIREKGIQSESHLM